MDFDTIHRIKVGGHYFQFYKTFDDFLQISFSFLYAGLKKGNACLWLVNDQMGIERAEKEFLGVYPEASAYLISHQLQIRSAQAWYLKKGSFDMAQALENAKIFLESCAHRDFACVRGIGDVGAVPDEDWMYVHEYEERFHSQVKSIPIIAVCAYPIHRCTMGDTKRVIENHHQPLFTASIAS